MEPTDGNFVTVNASPVATQPVAVSPSASTVRHASEATGRPIRVTVIQPSLAKYRLPVFQELARRPGIKLRVIYGAIKGLPNVEPDGFDAIPVRLRQGRIAGVLLSMQSAEWTYCSARHSDVVVLRWSPRSVTLLPGLMRARAAGLPTVVWGHGYSKDRRGKRIALRSWFGRRASALVFYEPRTRDAYIRDGWNPDRLFVALNSLDHTEIELARHWWHDHSDQLAQFRREKGIDDGPVILFVSRLQPDRRVDLLIRATAQLSRGFPALRTVIIGNGATERERLIRLTAELGAEGNVAFHEGIYDELQLAPWFLSADVMCFPANMGLSLLHSFWYGVPVVTSERLDIQGPEVVALEHGTNGLTYEHGSVESLVETLRQVLTNNTQRETMSDAARRTVEDRFTIPRMVDGLEAAIRYASSTVRKEIHRQ
jgi:glycosyltransferase involved in cell wall biosynthesis